MITDAENTAWHDAATRAAANARARIYDQLSGVPLDQADRVFIARTARDGDPTALATLLAKVRATDIPPGTTADRFEVDGNTIPYDHTYDPDRRVYVERREGSADGWMICPYTTLGEPVWNYESGDWDHPYADDFYTPERFERPRDEAIAQARRIVGLDDQDTNTTRPERSMITWADSADGSVGYVGTRRLFVIRNAGSATVQPIDASGAPVGPPHVNPPYTLHAMGDYYARADFLAAAKEAATQFWTDFLAATGLNAR
ncbi:hypothetical protein ACQP10_38350 (plasmid) [Streptosporangium sandarakinum]|uniref:hypothetical protein n=1 Tax=Streptosporangium sandarakinum TaxID=1260955 RepID=UPI003D94C35B